MSQYKSSANLKAAAKDKLDGRFGAAIAATFTTACITAAATFIVNSLLPVSTTLLWSVLSYVISAIISIFTGMFNAGLAYYFLKMSCGHTCSLADIFYGYTAIADKAIKVSLVFVVLELVCTAPYNLFMMLYLRTQDLTYLSLTFLGMALGLAVYIPVSLSISQSYYMLLDFPQYSAADALKGSIRVMKGHKGRFFYLKVSFLPLLLLSLLSCGIGLIWLTPYMRMTYTDFYLDLMNPQSANV